MGTQSRPQAAPLSLQGGGLPRAAPTSVDLASVSAPSPALDELAAFVRAHAPSIEFFQLVRLLHRLAPHAEADDDGRLARPDTGVARFTASPELGFPAGDIARLESGDGRQPPTVVVNFMGLIGPQGVLPLEYTALVGERVRAGDTALRDFLDIFHHRLIGQFHRAWEKTHFFAACERGREDPLARHVADLMGLAPGEDRAAVPGLQSVLFHSGLFGPQQRSAAALEQLLASHFGVEVEVVQFTGGWYSIDGRTQCAVGEERGESEQLGVGVVVGDAVCDPQAGVRIRVGPLSRQRYEAFLPAGRACEELRQLVRLFAGDHLDVQLQLVLKREEVPRCRIGEPSDAPLALGWFTWLGARSATSHDPDDTIFSL